MKLFAAALATVVTAASAVSIPASKLDTKKLMRGAVPVTRDGKPRRLDQDIQVSVYDSIQFNSCISLSTELAEEVQEQLAYYQDMLQEWEEGKIAAQASFVLFSICKTEYCGYQDESNLFMVDLASYMQLTGYRAQKTLDYCEACEQAYDWCMYDQYQNQYQAQDGDGGRKLAQVQYVACDTCASMGCFENMNNENQNNNNNGQQQIGLEDIVEWVQQMSECQDTGVQWDGVDLRSGFMCNADGTGVEIGVFLDEDCSVYAASQSYSSLFPNNMYMVNSQNVVTYPFVNDINCAEDIEWASPEEAYNQDGNNDNNNNNEEQQANEYCQQLIESDFVLPLDYCALKGGGDNQDNNNNNNQDNNNGENNNYAQYFYGYEYDLSEEDAEDAYAVCVALNTLQNSEGGLNAKQKNAYDNDAPTVYDYSAGKKASASKSGAGRTVGIIFAVLIALAIVGFVAWKFVLKKKMDSKKQPLVDGAMA